MNKCIFFIKQKINNVLYTLYSTLFKYVEPDQEKSCQASPPESA